MLAAVIWGVVAASSFVLGGAIALVRPPRPSWIAVGAGVGAGALIGAVAYELIDEAGAHAGRPFVVAAGLLAGALLAAGIFVGRGGLRQAFADAVTSAPALQHRFATLLLSVASEVVIIVGALGHGLSLAVIVAVFLCGVPEAIVGTVTLRAEGASRRRVMETWVALMGYGGVVAVVAHLVVSSAAGNLVAVFLSLAGGVVLSTIVAHLVPTSYARLGVLCAFPVVAGFALSVALVGVA
ncbi:hypothetical protein FE697_002070 [Mumia zhuanghuii]|uniref:Zinc transporter, ZIP family n=2 Tax=Mumia TaxID=1546255 RepID=A0ABW1QGG1_9ACTN|nr:MULTISPECIES: hypothetical protein [Mumia]KAA1424728.1 hypothetical protein FE697_002070 [Mumia zhuanghuii]